MRDCQHFSTNLICKGQGVKIYLVTFSRCFFCRWLQSPPNPRKMETNLWKETNYLNWLLHGATDSCSEEIPPSPAGFFGGIAMHPHGKAWH